MDNWKLEDSAFWVLRKDFSIRKPLSIRLSNQIFRHGLSSFLAMRLTGFVR